MKIGIEVVVEVVDVVDVVGTDVDVVDVEVVDVVEVEVVDEELVVVAGMVVVPPPLGPLGEAPHPGTRRAAAPTTAKLSKKMAKRCMTGANYTGPAFRL